MDKINIKDALIFFSQKEDRKALSEVLGMTPQGVGFLLKNNKQLSKRHTLLVKRAIKKRRGSIDRDFQCMEVIYNQIFSK